MRNRKQIGLAIARMRDVADLTQQQVALKVGISRSSVANIEAGLQGMSADLLADIAAALGTTASGLLDDYQPGGGHVSVKLVAQVAEQQRALTRKLTEVTELILQVAEQSERIERLFAEHSDEVEQGGANRD